MLRLRLHTIWTGTTIVPSPFLVSTNWFLIITNAFRNGSVTACSTACCSAAALNELSARRTVP